jgi:hypothetical protein
VQLPVNEVTFLLLANELNDIIESWVEASLWFSDDGEAGWSMTLRRPVVVRHLTARGLGILV